MTFRMRETEREGMKKNMKKLPFILETVSISFFVSIQFINLSFNLFIKNSNAHRKNFHLRHFHSLLYDCKSIYN